MTSQPEKSTLPRPVYKTYGEIVWGQFKKYRMSYYSLWGIYSLILIAVIAPLLALNVPFFLHVPEGVGPQNMQGTHFPWFASLFDRNFFDGGVDIFFNFLLFALPIAFLGWQVAKRIKPPQRPQDYKVVRFKYIMWSSLLVLIGFSAVYLYGFRQPFVDYGHLSQLDGVKSIFPFFEYSYREGNVMSVVASPSWDNWLGTDQQGRDVFTRLLYGTRISLTIGVVAVGIYTFIGLVLGSLAGYFGGRIDNLVLRMIEIMICFPTFFLILTLTGFVEQPSIFHIMIIIGLTGWTGIARLVRGEFLRLKNQDFVQAAIALGLNQNRIIFRHVLPNALGPVFVAATFGIAGAILIEASLSFLGLGPATAPSWGQILTEGRQTGEMAMILAPGFAIFVTVSLLNLVGEGFRDATDPKMRK